MATTGLWPVKNRLKEVIEYAENPDTVADIAKHSHSVHRSRLVLNSGKALREDIDAGDANVVILAVERKSDVRHPQKIVRERFFLLRYPF